MSLDEEDLKKIEEVTKAKWMSLPTISRAIIIAMGLFIVLGMITG